MPVAWWSIVGGFAVAVLLTQLTTHCLASGDYIGCFAVVYCIGYAQFKSNPPSPYREEPIRAGADRGADQNAAEKPLASAMGMESGWFSHAQAGENTEKKGGIFCHFFKTK